MTLPSEQLARCIDEKRHCLRQLHELGLRQLESIAAGDFSQLMKILAGKQRLVTSLQAIEQQLHPFRDESPQARYWASNDARQRTAQAAQECRQLLDAILDQERAGERLLSAQRDQVAAELQHAHDATFARNAYQSVAQSRAAGIDLSTES